MNLDLLPDRLGERIEVTPAGCWLWQGTVSQGYGLVRWEGASERVHRLVYRLLVAPIPTGAQIGHLCHDEASHAGLCPGGPCLHRACCNPAHLAAQTPRENTLAAATTTAARELAQTHCRSGHPYDEANTYLAGDGARRCRRCRCLAAYRWRERHGRID